MEFSSGAPPSAAAKAATDSPHYQIRHRRRRHAVPGRGQRQSAGAPSELLYLVDDDFRHPVTAALPALGAGWTPLPSRRRRRARLHPRQPVRPRRDAGAAARRGRPGQRPRRPARPLRPAGDRRAGRGRVRRSASAGAPKPHVQDKVFGFLPGNGVHDIHMNQGNSRRFTRRRRRLAGRRAAAPLPRRVPLGRHLPRLPEPGLAHRRHDRPRARTAPRRAPPVARGRCGSSPRWSTRSGRHPELRP